MIFFKSSTDASYLYRPSTAAENNQYTGTAVRGNLSDRMNNVLVIRTSYVAPSNTVVSSSALAGE